MLRAIVPFVFLLSAQAFAADSGGPTTGKDEGDVSKCWSADQYNATGDCSACANLTFDCSQHKITVNGQDPPDLSGNDDYVGCASQTGNDDEGKKDHKITGRGCGGGGTLADGKSPALGTDQPKLTSDNNPCHNCTIHKVNPGGETAGCIGVAQKGFDWVATKCVGCPYKITPMGGSGTGKGSAPAGGAQTGS